MSNLIRKDLDKNTLDVIAGYMQDDIREKLHNDLAPCSPAEFLDAYIAADPTLIPVLDQEFVHVYA